MSDGIRGPVVIFDKFLTPEQCRETIEYGKQYPKQKAKISDGVLDETVRKNNIYSVSSNRGTPAMMTGAAFNINWDIFKFDITHVSQSDLLEYYPGGLFKNHIDTFLKKDWNETRKLSTLIILNNEYEGGELVINHQSGSVTVTKENMGDLIVFPSTMQHGVYPVKSGVRYSMINWLLGPSFV